MFTSGRREAFVVRVWVEPTQAEQTDELRAVVEHVGSGATVYVTTYADLVAAIRGLIGTSDDTVGSGS